MRGGGFLVREAAAAHDLHEHKCGDKFDIGDHGVRLELEVVISGMEGRADETVFDDDARVVQLALCFASIAVKKLKTMEPLAGASLEKVMVLTLRYVGDAIQ